jgi:hypothetical protein
MGWVMGFEPTNAGITIRCVNHFAIPTIPTKVTFSLLRLLSLSIRNVSIKINIFGMLHVHGLTT